MTSEQLQATLQEATAEVLETMFFACIDGTEVDPPTDGLTAHVEFHGSCSGKLGFSASVGASDMLAGGFSAGEEGPSTMSTQDVVNEFANIVCGAVLTRLDPRGEFYLTTTAGLGDVASASMDVINARSVLDVGCGAIELEMLVGPTQ